MKKGAILLISGPSGCGKSSLLKKVYKEIEPDKLLKDYKTALQEITQAHFGCTPDYRLLSSSCPDHKKEFEISIELQHRVIASAIGRSKKEAQQRAAHIALRKLQEEK